METVLGIQLQVIFAHDEQGMTEEMIQEKVKEEIKIAIEKKDIGQYLSLK